ncbi:hypothetical protein [Nonomuraea candida]|uniref:hypothetical protein n=1 Tax=Nonomuraea candida TaxID=359159 RepID=UPI0005B9EA07|nr:hypothetical protein [Nonomuraea candida]
MISTRPYAGYLHTELTALGFADLGHDPEEMGGYDALFTRVYQGFGYLVEVHEQYGDVTLRVFGPGEATEGENTYRNGHLTETTFKVEMPTVIVMGAISAAVNQDTDRLYAVPAVA